jgi:hypothetical protein
MGSYIVRLKNDPSGINDLNAFLRDYYESRNREIRFLSPGTFGRGSDGQGQLGQVLK